MQHQRLVKLLTSLILQRRFSNLGNGRNLLGHRFGTVGYANSVKNVEQIFFATFVGAAVALDELAATCNFKRQKGRYRKCSPNATQPFFNQGLLGDVAVAIGPEDAQQ